MLNEIQTSRFLASVEIILDTNQVPGDEKRDLLARAAKIAEIAQNPAHAQALMERYFPWGVDPRWLRPIRVDNLDSETGEKYLHQYLQPYTLFVHEFNELKKEDIETRIFVPYTGNEHNRRWFPHLLIKTIAKHEYNLTGVIPDYFEPCVGSGQIYMNTKPKRFAQATLGDINPFLISVYRSVLTRGEEFISTYASKAEHWDLNPGSVFSHAKDWLADLEPFSQRTKEYVSTKSGYQATAQWYLYVMNRSQLAPKLRQLGGLSGAKLMVHRASPEVRAREVAALRTLHRRMTAAAAPPTLLHEDLAVTMGQAERSASAVIVVDAPFPEFSYTKGVKAINCYGTDDGGDLQDKLLNAAVRLYRLNRPVIICNYATPWLIEKYQQNGAYPIFSFKSPKDHTIYMLAVFYKSQGTEILQKVQRTWFEWVESLD